MLTSLSGAIVYGKAKGQRSGMYTEADWTDLTNKQDTTPYSRSKTIAERAAWEFMESDRSSLEFTRRYPRLAVTVPLKYIASYLQSRRNP